MNSWSNPNYGKSDGSLLFDEITGSSSYGDAKWTGLKDKIDVDVDLGTNQTISNVSIGVLDDIGTWIFPAASIQIYGGSSKENLKLIGEKYFEAKKRI